MYCSFCEGHPYVIYSTAVIVPDPTLLTSEEGSRRCLSPLSVSGSLAFPCMHDCYTVVLYHSTGAVDQNCSVKPSPVSGNTLAFLVIPHQVVRISLGIRRIVGKTLSFCSEVVSIFKTVLYVFVDPCFLNQLLIYTETFYKQQLITTHDPGKQKEILMSTNQ